MHYYQFNIGDYSSHTSRLSIYEDIAYRRLLDLYYLNERPLNGCSTDVAREIGMLDSLGDVEFVLNKFFTEKSSAWHNKRCDQDIRAYKSKQKTAKKAGIASGIARNKKRTTVERPLNAKATDVEPTINHKPLTINQETKIKRSGFQPPSQKEVEQYCFEKDYSLDAEAFICFYESKGWMVGKNKMKNWKAALTNWQKRDRGNNSGQQTNGYDSRGRAQKVSDKLDEIARKDIEQNGFTSELG